MKWYLLLMLWISVGHSTYVYIDEDCLIFPAYPAQYKVTLTPYLNGDQFYYEGEITIEVISLTGQNTIELDSRDLDIHEDTVGVFIDNRNIVDKRRPITVDQRRGKIIIHLREALRPYSGLNGHGGYVSGKKNEYYIKMRFRGNINRTDKGLFATSYKEGNTVKWLLSTRLSPNYASSVFPCFDNPRMEAGYVITVNKPPSLHTILSVSKEVRRHNTSSYTMVEFAPSPQIPSYKFGLHLSEFMPRQVSPVQPEGSYLVLWTRRSQNRHYYFLLNFGNRILSTFNSYMNTSRPITSAPINIIAIPNYWRSYEKGAWNLLTVAESKFLIDEEQVSALQREQMEFELSRQLARVWLGNPDQVSKTKWKQEWFKEGMATYFGYYFMVWGDMYQRGPDAFGLQTLFRAMAADSKSRIPLSSFNITSADVLKTDDEELITMKTASILRMIEYWLGSDVFHKAVRDYLHARHGQTISIKDFGDFLQRDAIQCEFFKGYTVSNVIGSWVNQPGYPLINVTIYRDRHVITLNQQHFNLDPQNDVISSQYLIPISYTTQVTENCINCIQPRFIMSRSNYDFQENLNGGWIILNRKASGYYRVNYDAENWELIARTLDSVDRNRIDVPNRAQIVNDVFALRAAALMNLNLATRILGSLKEEEDLGVWDAAFQGYELMKQSQSMTKESYEFWKKFMSDQVSKIYYKQMTQNRQDYQARVFRSRIVNFACSVDLPACLNDMRNLKLGPAGKVLDSDLREAYYRVQLKQDNGWFEVKRHLETCNVYERDDILSSKKKFDDEKMYKNLPPGPEKIIMSTTTPSVHTGCCTPSPNEAATSMSTYVIDLVTMVALLCLIT